MLQPILAASVALLTLSGCAGAEPSAPTAPTAAFASYDLEANEGYPEARLSGSIEIVDGCLYYNMGAEPDVLALPADSVVGSDSVIVRGSEFPFGEPVAFGGGGFPSAPSGVTVPSECDADAGVVLAYPLPEDMAP